MSNLILQLNFIQMNRITFLFIIGLIVISSCSKKRVEVFEDKSGNPKAVTGGDFKYFADAAVFRPCGQKKVFPVSHDGEYIDLEKKYLKKKEGGEWLYTEVLGRFENQKNMEGKVVKTFVIEKLVRIDESRICGNEP